MKPAPSGAGFFCFIVHRKRDVYCGIAPLQEQT